MGVVNGVRAFAPLLIAQGSGHFLNTASAGGLMPLPSLAPYAATMHAIVGPGTDAVVRQRVDDLLTDLV
jgi:NADP-dependent 3-hydroxy acid dehydrogenase YdfG